jgi:hypothetical protein
VPQPRWVERVGEREGGKARWPETGVREVEIPRPISHASSCGPFARHRAVRAHSRVDSCVTSIVVHVVSRLSRVRFTRVVTRRVRASRVSFARVACLAARRSHVSRVSMMRVA